MSRILIIDDNDDVREELKDRIAAMGHQSEEAGTLEEALVRLSETAFDCVLLDLALPVKFEGVARIEHGKNLLQRIVAMNDAPPVIVMTGHGLQGHKLAIETIDLGATTFVGKPFESDPIEPKIERVLAKQSRPSAPAVVGNFEGGALVLREGSIEISGVYVGGSRANAYIRKIILTLRERASNGDYKRFSAKALAEATGSDVSPQTITSAIKDFRTQCQQKLGCGPNDVIRTWPGGGYQLADWIEVRSGSDDHPATQIEHDQQIVLSEIRKHGCRTLRQLSETTVLPQARLKSALSELKDKKLTTLIGSGKVATYSINPES